MKYKARMPPSTKAHSRSHSLLLLQKLLNLRESSASPLTLVLDTLEQPAAALLMEFALRAKVSNCKTILVSFTTVTKPNKVDALVIGRGKDLEALRKEIIKLCPPLPGTLSESKENNRALILIDTLNPITCAYPSQTPAFLSSLVAPNTSVVGVYHLDIPAVNSPAQARNFPSQRQGFHREYEPEPMKVISHLATAIFTLSSLSHEVQKQRARNKSLQEPDFGLDEGREGVLIGLKNQVWAGAENSMARGFVLEMEMRRRSGRAVIEKFILIPGAGKFGLAAVGRLCDHSEFRSPDAEGGMGLGEETPESTFNLGLTEKQRRDRDGVVLPYFDAQTDIGGGEGGRILYEMGREDDFDEEEDEI